jgi:dTDP-4-amino-4,6-dideoxygalactose transaminase
MGKQLAILGGNPSFQNFAQRHNYLPVWKNFEKMVDGIYTRKYYTNHGPLAQELEKKLSAFLGVKHAICMTNTGIGLMIAIKALDLKGKVIVPAFSHISLSQAIIWADLEPVFCDVNVDMPHLNADSLNNFIEEDTCAVMGVNLFGDTCDYDGIEKVASKFSIRHYYVSDDAVGEEYKENKIGNFGSLEIFSLHESKIINSIDGCVITTNDDFVAARLRNIRSSYGSGPTVPISFTGNGRMSEVQAGMALLTLEEFEGNVKENKKTFGLYEDYLDEVEGISIYKPRNFVSNRNYQRLVIRIDENKFGVSALRLSKVFQAENICANTFIHYALNPWFPNQALSNMPNARRISSSLLELPVRKIEPGIVCSVIKQALHDAKKINNLLND